MNSLSISQLFILKSILQESEASGGDSDTPSSKSGSGSNNSGTGSNTSSDSDRCDTDLIKRCILCVTGTTNRC